MTSKEQPVRTSSPLLPETGFIRKPTVLALAGFGSTKLHYAVKEGSFPAPIKLGPRMVAWRAEDIRSWIEKTGAPQPIKEAA
jgi:prophage regulatory protein